MRRLSRFGSSFVIGLSLLLGLAVPSAFAAGTFTCTWTAGGDGIHFSDAANWSGCNSAAPQPADNDDLVFPVTVATANGLINDLTSATFNSITVNGTVTLAANEHDYEIGGNAFSLSGGITNSAVDGLASNAPMALIVAADMTLTADQTLQNTRVTYDITDPTPSFNIGSNNITFVGDSIVNGTSAITTTVVGSGSIIVGGGALDLNGTLTGFTGSLEVQNNGLLKIEQAQMGTIGNLSDITVDSGGTLYFANPGTNSLSFPVNLSGTGATIGTDQYAALELHGSGTLTLDGLVTLGSDVEALLDNANLTLTQAPDGDFTLSSASASTGTLTVPPSDPADDSDDSDDPSGSGSSNSTSAPGTPDTGFAAVLANPLLVLAMTSLAATMLYAVARHMQVIGNERG
ncbi:MAG TPA: hypothetical protein VHB51_01520 [Candidatus Saccharimonadales bacterium]|nr:hypothetical protein [Candidatus Saccharimonadales bacterium]